MSRPTAGQPAPAFRGLNQQGETVSLDQFKGKKVALYFYPKDDTPGCTAEACSLRDNEMALKAKGIEVVGVSSDSVKSHARFATKYSLPFPLIADEDKSIHAAYDTWVEKSMYGRKYMGTDRVTFLIDENGIIEKVIDKVKTKEHAAQLL